MMPRLTGGFIVGGLCLALLSLLYPASLRRLLRFRWMILLGGLLVVSLLFGTGETDWQLLGLPVSSADLLSGLQMCLRAVVILLAADGLAASVDISEVAGLFERVGLHGLGFSLGVAVNLLPNLRQSATNTWHSLRMRGGMRAQWWRGSQLLLLTILTSALRRSEEIALAAEARAFRPERSRALPIKIGRLDWWLIAIGALSLPSMYFLLTSLVR
jgi:energy-coupling factor transporter transmembrane protein EcfT